MGVDMGKLLHGGDWIVDDTQYWVHVYCPECWEHLGARQVYGVQLREYGYPMMDTFDYWVRAFDLEPCVKCAWVRG